MTAHYSLLQIKADLRAGEYAWPGGYPRYFITADGAALSFATVRANWRDVVASYIYDSPRSGWHVVATDINWEDTDLTDDHTGERIPSAYSEDAWFIVEGVDTADGSRTELVAFDNSGEAQAFLQRYTSKENAGNWDLIEVYDVRGEDAECLWVWEREV